MLFVVGCYIASFVWLNGWKVKIKLIFYAGLNENDQVAASTMARVASGVARSTGTQPQAAFDWHRWCRRLGEIIIGVLAGLAAWNADRAFRLLFDPRQRA